MFKKYISEHFTWDEFYYHKSSDHYVDRTPINEYLVKYLVNNILEPIREYFGFPMIITSGIRDKFIYENMKRRGYHPSKHTDHFYLDMEIKPFPYGLGAADFQMKFPDMKINSSDDRYKKRMFDIYKRIILEMDLNYYQIIYYTKWGSIHISNPRECVLSQSFITNVFNKYYKHYTTLLSDNGLHYIYKTKKDIAVLSYEQAVYLFK